MPLEMLYRYARHARFVDGADEVHRESVARQILRTLHRAGGRAADGVRARRGARPRYGSSRTSSTPSPSRARGRSSMKAVQLVRWQAEPELREVEVPEPGPGEVLVEVVSDGPLSLRPARDGVAGGPLPWQPAVHARSRERPAGSPRSDPRTAGLERGACRCSSTGHGVAAPAGNAPRRRQPVRAEFDRPGAGAGSASTGVSPTTWSCRRRACSSPSASSTRSPRRR